MNKKEEEIQRKLVELESSVLKETQHEVLLNNDKTQSELTGGYGSLKTDPGAKAGAGSSSSTAALNKNDGAYFAGMLSIFLGIFMVFSHVKVGSSFLAMLAGGGGVVAVFLLPLLIGVGMLFYNYKSKWGRGITALSVVGFLLAVLFTLNFTFPPLSMLQTVMMFLPFAIGGALVVKGLGGPKGVEEAIKHQLPQKEDA